MYKNIENIKDQIGLSCGTPKDKFSMLYLQIATCHVMAADAIFNQEILLLFFTTITKLYVGRISSTHFTFYGAMAPAQVILGGIHISI